MSPRVTGPALLLTALVVTSACHAPSDTATSDATAPGAVAWSPERVRLGDARSVGLPSAGFGAAVDPTGSVALTWDGELCVHDLVGDAQLGRVAVRISTRTRWPATVNSGRSPLPPAPSGRPEEE